MKTFALILFFHVGFMGKTDSNTSTSITGFANKPECEAAGMEAQKLVDGTVKEVRYICVEQTK